MRMSHHTAIAIRHLTELVEALARRVPQVHRQEEAAIARDSKALTEQALARLKTLEDDPGPLL
jgi:hypothetical protein